MLEEEKGQRISAFCRGLGGAGTRVTVILPSGQVIGESEEDPQALDNHGARPEIKEALAGSVGRWTRYSATLREDLMYVAVPVPDQGKTRAVVRAAIPLTGLRKVLASVRWHVLLAGAAGSLLAAAASLAVSRWVSRPLEAIKAGAERFARGELEHRLPPSGFAEISALAETMNGMAQQLDERIGTILRQHNEREAMWSSMEDGVLAIDNGGTIVSLNEACAALLGSPPSEVLGRPVGESLRRPELLRFVESALASAEPVGGDLEFPAPDQRWLNVHGTALLDAERRKIGVLIILRDVTRLHRLETVRRDFVANVSHELRTPITSIKGFIETLLDGAVDDKENADRFLHILQRQADRLNAIVEDLLLLSRIEKGSEEHLIQLAPKGVRGVLTAAIEMCQQKAADKQIAVRLCCAEDLLAKTNGSLLEQAVVNLLDNAIKYSEPKGCVEIAGCREGAETVISVQDQGCGIEARHLPRLFERFYRVDQARSRELGGTGLGLAIVKHIAIAHGGSVSAESAVGQGSTFYLRLPATTAD
jgi:two-component system phosphate regulon sensor histidine kinase PhoR